MPLQSFASFAPGGCPAKFWAGASGPTNCNVHSAVGTSHGLDLHSTLYYGALQEIYLHVAWSADKREYGVPPRNMDSSTVQFGVLLVPAQKIAGQPHRVRELNIWSAARGCGPEGPSPCL